MAEEIQNNQRLANKFAARWKQIEIEKETETSREAVWEKKKKKPGKEYLYPEGFDAFRIYYDEGSPGLYRCMSGFSADELKGVLVHFTSLPRESYVRKRDNRLLLEMAVEGVKKLAGRSEAFGDFKLPK